MTLTRASIKTWQRLGSLGQILGRDLNESSGDFIGHFYQRKIPSILIPQKAGQCMSMALSLYRTTSPSHLSCPRELNTCKCLGPSISLMFPTSKAQFSWHVSIFAIWSPCCIEIWLHRLMGWHHIQNSFLSRQAWQANCLDPPQP